MTRLSPTEFAIQIAEHRAQARDRNTARLAKLEYMHEQLTTLVTQLQLDAGKHESHARNALDTTASAFQSGLARGCHTGASALAAIIASTT